MKSGFGVKYKVIGIVLVVLVLGASMATSLIYYRKYQELNRMTADQFSQRSNQKIIGKVSRLYSLPTDEQPSIATIKDKETVKKQYPFLSQAENDDILLLYQKAQLAILYRPSTGQLVKVGALNISDDKAASARIKVIGAITDRENVGKLLTDSKLTFTQGEAKSSYSGVTVVDLTGKNEAQAKNLATIVKGQVGSLPTGEDKPADVDLLIIAGSAN